MQFRRTCACDIDRIMSILADGRASLAALGIDQWQGGYPHRAVIEDDTARGDSYVVEADDRIVATAMIGFSGERDYDRIEEGSWLTSCTSERPCYGVVHRVAVASDGKNRGAATFLLARAEELARANGSASVRIDTHPGNAPMRKLLAKAAMSSAASSTSPMPKGGRPSASLTSGSCSQASFFRDSGDRKGASLSGTRRSGAVPFSFLSKFCRSRASADARSPQGIIRSTMSVKSREKIALAVFAALIVLSLLGLGWYLVAGHSWNVAASNIDDTFGSMDGYTAIVYEGTAVPQTAARRRRKRRRRKKPRRGCWLGFFGREGVARARSCRR